jgi:hypothetical protein
VVADASERIRLNPETEQAAFGPLHRQLEARRLMKSRIATISTMVLLVAGTGGAIAIGAAGSSGGPQGGAASAQYCASKTNPKCKQPKPKHNCGRYHNQQCPTKPKKCYYTVHGHRHSYQCPATTKHKSKKHKTTHKSTGKNHKSTSKKSTGNKNGSSKCTTRTVHGLTVLYCSST